MDIEIDSRLLNRIKKIAKGYRFICSDCNKYRREETCSDICDGYKLYKIYNLLKDKVDENRT